MSDGIQIKAPDGREDHGGSLYPSYGTLRTTVGGLNGRGREIGSDEIRSMRVVIGVTRVQSAYTVATECTVSPPQKFEDKSGGGEKRKG